MPDQERQKVKVFISYAHDDEEYFKVFIKRLEKVLKPSPDFDYQIWDDRDIHVGSDWNKSIQDNLASADVAILLVSDSFLASDYIEGKEFGHLIEKHPSTLIIPVLFAPCEFSQWDKLGKIQFFVANGADYEEEHIVNFTFAHLAMVRGVLTFIVFKKKGKSLTLFFSENI